MINADTIAQKADVIINGFAVVKEDNLLKIINLNNLYGVAVLKPDGTLIETNMDSIELSIANAYMQQALAYIEE